MAIAGVPFGLRSEGLCVLLQPSASASLTDCLLQRGIGHGGNVDAELARSSSAAASRVTEVFFFERMLIRRPCLRYTANLYRRMIRIKQRDGLVLGGPQSTTTPLCLAFCSGSTWMVTRIALDGLAQRRLDPVADRVRLGDGHLRRHHEVELDEGDLPGEPCPDVVRLDRAVGVRRDQRADAARAPLPAPPRPSGRRATRGPPASRTRGC